VRDKGALLDSLSREAAGKIVQMLRQTPASGDASIVMARVQAFVRHALETAVQPPEDASNRAFRLIARGVIAQPPEVVSTRCVAFRLVGTDYIGPHVGTQDTEMRFLAYDRVAREIARRAKRGDTLDLVSWVRGRSQRSPDAPSEASAELAFEVESFRIGKPGRAARERSSSQKL
jgi:hypothetical protein